MNSPYSYNRWQLQNAAGHSEIKGYICIVEVISYIELLETWEKKQKSRNPMQALWARQRIEITSPGVNKVGYLGAYHDGFRADCDL